MIAIEWLSWFAARSCRATFFTRRRQRSADGETAVVDPAIGRERGQVRLGSVEDRSSIQPTTTGSDSSAPQRAWPRPDRLHGTQSDDVISVEKIGRCVWANCHVLSTSFVFQAWSRRARRPGRHSRVPPKRVPRGRAKHGNRRHFPAGYGGGRGSYGAVEATATNAVTETTAATPVTAVVRVTVTVIVILRRRPRATRGAAHYCDGAVEHLANLRPSAGQLGARHSGDVETNSEDSGLHTGLQRSVHFHPEPAQQQTKSDLITTATSPKTVYRTNS